VFCVFVVVGLVTSMASPLGAEMSLASLSVKVIRTALVIGGSGDVVYLPDELLLELKAGHLGGELQCPTVQVAMCACQKMT
jgi:hypothetical protein